MWPFKKRNLPPPPISQELFPQSAAVVRITSALQANQRIPDHLSRTRPVRLVVHLEKVGAATAYTAFGRDGGTVINWVSWVTYDRHAKRRARDKPEEETVEDQFNTVELTLPTSPMEQMKHMVILRDNEGNFYVLEPTRPVY